MIHTRRLLRSTLWGGLLVPALVANAQAQDWSMAPLVVSTSMMDTPYQLQSDPRQPRASAPAPDGGAYLKDIPGFSVSRKGGTAGEPALRGLGGSRLSILADGTSIGGGCTGRMDPPTAYIFPQSYDRIEITKGPQSVRYGVAPAGSVRFERDTPDFEQPDTRGMLSYTGGSFNRNDLAAEVLTGSSAGYLRFNSLLSTQDDYRDGDGERVHSQFERWSTQVSAGWTPDERTIVEATYERSDAESAYDDRRMDGTDFDRTGYRLRAERRALTPWLEAVEAQYFYNDIDHVMDNFRLRDPQMMTMARRVQRRSSGARVDATLLPLEDALVEVGVDYVENQHGDSGRIAEMGEPLTGLNFRQEPVDDVARFLDLGVFMEWEQTLGEGQWLTAGVRGDYHEVRAQSGEFSNVGGGATDHSGQWSAFARYEHALAQTPVTLYTGFGRSERAPDFWERGRDFFLSTEVLNQADLGLSYNTDRIDATLSLFYGVYDDYILVTEEGDSAANVNAEQFGGEADVTIALNSAWQAQASLAYTRARNKTDRVALAQTPPLEATLGVEYSENRWLAGALWRGVARQHRIDPGSGTIYSLDTEQTPGFATASVYAGYQLSSMTRMTVGADNLFDRQFSEHIQRGSADFGASDERIAEPGRYLWANVAVEF